MASNCGFACGWLCVRLSELRCGNSLWDSLWIVVDRSMDSLLDRCGSLHAFVVASINGFVLWFVVLLIDLVSLIRRL